MTHYRSFELLSTNTKLEKQNGIRYLVAGLSLAPHGLSDVIDVCPQSTAGCRSSCVLWFTGRTVTQSVRAAMRRRTRWLATDRQGFLDALYRDIESHQQRAAALHLQPTIRLNVASDLDWAFVAADFPNVRFYDYTKVRGRLSRPDWPRNYELTYSANEHSDARYLGRLLAGGRNVACVFSTRYHPQSGRIDRLPETWRFGSGRAWRVVDGDTHDVRLRETDGAGNIIGLRFKGGLRRRAAAVRNGFCFDVGGP